MQLSDCLWPVCLPSLVVGHTTYTLLAPHLPDMETTGSPQLTQHHYTTLPTSNPRGVVHILAYIGYTHIGFRFVNSVATPDVCDFGAKLPYDPAT